MENEESMVRGLCIWENILHGIVALNEGKLDLLIGMYRVHRVKRSGGVIMMKTICLSFIQKQTPEINCRKFDISNQVVITVLWNLSYKNSNGNDV